MPTVVECPSCGAPLQPSVAACPFCRVALAWGDGGTPKSEKSGAPAEVLRELRAGNKIGAIKAYHQATKCSLKEAKDYVDALEQRLARG